MARKTSWIATIGGLAVIAAALTCFGKDKNAAKKRVLFFTQSAGHRHGVVRRPLTGEISHAEKIFKKIATKAGYEVSLSQDYHDLGKKDHFEKYDAIVTYTSGDPKIDRAALMEWVRAGGAFMGIHASTDSFKDDPAYVKFIGAAFKTHAPGNKEVTIKVEDPNHPATKMLGSEWKIVDEIYQFNGFVRDNVHMLLSIDMDKTNLKQQKMERGKYYPVSWTRAEGKGRVFYTSLGHREDVWTNPVYQQHLLGGLAWALRCGESKCSAAGTQR
jgi:type 1 glutamine amidotransferase